MNARRTQRVMDAATPSLRAGESIEFVTAARFGTPSRKKQTIVLLLSIILTLGLIRVFVFARPYYLVLTSQRLLLFGIGRGTGAPTAKPVQELPREGLSVTRPRSRLSITFYLSRPGTQDRFRLAFGQPQRKDAHKLANAIGITQG